MASIFVKADYQLMKINLKDIELIEGLDDYIRIHTKPKPVLTLMTLKSLQEKLPPMNLSGCIAAILFLSVKSRVSASRR